MCWTSRCSSKPRGCRTRRRRPVGKGSMRGWLVALALLASVASVWAQGEPEVYFLSPKTGATIEGAPLVTVTGRARGPRIEPTSKFDVMLIIDTSGSTATPSRGLLDSVGWGSGSGRIIRLPKALARDSILGAEVSAALSFLAQVDGLRTRVGVV